jgi:hypothetical protein
MSVRLRQDGDDVLVWIKVVPGASRDAIVGPLGDRLKVRVGAPPEGGKANAAVERLLAEAFQRRSEVLIVAGHGSAEKQVRICGITAEEVRTCFLGEV